MQSEERHELQKNDLVGGASWLYLFVRRNGLYMLLGLALALVAFEFYKLHQTQVARRLAEARAELDVNQTPKAIYAKVLAQYHNPEIDAQAYIKIGQFYLTYIAQGNVGTTYMGVKATQDQAVAGAKLAFKNVIENYPNLPLMIARAKLGLANAYEDAGQWSKARAIYVAMLDAKATPAEKSFAGIVNYRLKNLDAWRRPVLADRTAVNTANGLSLPTSTIGPQLPAKGFTPAH